MKIHCANPDCVKTTHPAALRLKLPGAGRMEGEQWFCGRRCFRNFAADQLIVDHRHGLKKTVHRLKLGLLLVKNKLISKEQLTAALEEKSGSLKKLGRILLDSGRITPKELKAALSMQAGVSPINLDEKVKLKLKDEIPFKLIDEFRFALFDFDEETRFVTAALCDIDSILPLQEYFEKVYPGYRVKFFLEEEERLLKVIAANYPGEKLSPQVERQLPPSSREAGDTMETSVLKIIEFFNALSGHQVKIDNLDDAVWLKSETGDLKIDVYLSRKPGAENNGTAEASSG
jgi:hypothetical protein